MKHLLLFIPLFAFFTVQAQLTVTATGNSGSCAARVINTSVSGGSGNYMYIYSLDAGETGPAVNSANVASYTVNPQPLKKTRYRVVAIDLVSGLSGTTTVTLLQSTNIDPPIRLSNAITPNGDHVNDVWYVHNIDDVSNLSAPIGATEYELEIVSSSGGSVLSSSGHNDDGLWTSAIYWNGRFNNVGARVPANNTYYYSLKLINCKYPSGKTYTGWIYVNY